MTMFEEDSRMPPVISTRNIMLALGAHVAVFLVFWIFSAVNFQPKETIIPIDLVFEAPPEEIAPEDVPEPTPEPPKVTPKVPEPPPVVEEKVDAVVKIKDEKKPEKPKEKPKPPEPEKPKEKPKPEKTPEQIKKEKAEAKKERLRKMREGAKVVKNPKPTPVAGTGQKLDPNWEKLLKQGYKPSDHTELAQGEEQRCYSLIKSAFYDKWDRPPWTDTLKEMILRVYFGPGGRVVSYKLEKSSGDARADQTVISAAKSVRVVAGLSEEFIRSKKMSGIPIRFKVTPQ